MPTLGAIIVDKPNEENVLSLGVFGLRRNTDRLKERVEKMNFDVETEARYRERTSFRLYGEQSSEQEMQRLLGEAEASDGISQIRPGACRAEPKTIKFAAPLEG